MDQTYLLTILILLAGVSMTGLGYPLWKQMIPPNIWYGFRTRRTRSDPTLWYAVNRLLGKDMMIAGAVTTTVAAVILLLGAHLSPIVGTAILAAVLLVSVILMTIRGARYLYKN